MGLPASRLSAGSVPWAGLVRSATEVPDLADVEARLATESLFVFVTADDTRLDHIRAGYAMERAWLTAVDLVWRQRCSRSRCTSNRSGQRCAWTWC
ncbi:hypothetical protein ACGFMK_39175 [Amycolatopsis sp. NPDC049252]|uniref:hypothetical protein n=1 Tax=Amycolatopsis sp. NPDC049252 TaxID=3363933 RepID=UPI00371EB81B